MKKISRRNLFVRALTKTVDQGLRAAGVHLRTIEELEHLHPDAVDTLIPQPRREAGLVVSENRLWRRTDSELKALTDLEPLEVWLAEAADGCTTLAALRSTAPDSPSRKTMRECFFRLLRLHVLIPAEPPENTT